MESAMGSHAAVIPGIREERPRPSERCRRARRPGMRVPGAVWLPKAMWLTLTWIAAMGLAGLFPPAALGQPQQFHSREEALRLAFPNGETFRPVALAFSAEVQSKIEKKAQAKVLREVIECFQGVSQGQVTGYACIDNEIGRERFITYIIRIDHPAGEIRFIEVMEYREAVGAIVAYPHFTRRFKGLTAKDPIRAGMTVPRIIGATLSCRALAAGSRKILQVYDLYLRNLPVQRAG